MMSFTSAGRPWRLAGMVASTLLTALFLFGCGDSGPAQVEDTTGHGQETSKNMENFMKSKPYQNVAKEKVQVK